MILRGLSSAGRAPDLHSGGQRFDPARLHHFLGIRSFMMKLVGAGSSARLERTPDKREVGGSSPPRPTIHVNELSGIATAFIE